MADELQSFMDSFDSIKEEVLGERKVLEPGTYRCAVVVDGDKGTRMRESASTGRPYIQMVYKVLEGPEEGSRVFQQLSLVGKPFALGITKRTLRCLGAGTEVVGWCRENGGMQEVIPLLAGRICDVVVVVRQDQNRRQENGEPYPPRNEVTSVEEVEQDPIETASMAFGGY